MLGLRGERVPGPVSTEPSTVSFIAGEVPSGTVNSSNTVFTLANTPISGTVNLYQNGIRLQITTDYTISSTTITFNTAPTTGDLLLADYIIYSGTYATGSASFVSNETPSGTVNGSNVTFTLVSAPVTGTLALYRDGQLMTGGGADYSLSGSTITFTTAPATSSVLLAFYQSAASTAGNADMTDSIHASDYYNYAGGFLTSDYQGWQKVSETFTYASASTITISAGGASRYQVGDKIKFTQTTVKYFVVSVVADTLLTVIVNNDYTVANAAISAIYVSREDRPFGFPNWFAFTPGSITGWAATPTVNIARYGITGRLAILRVDITGTSNATSVNFTVPIIAANTGTVEAGTVMTYAQDNGSELTTPCRALLTTSTVNCYKNMGSGTWTNTNGKRIQFTMVVEI